MDQKPAFNAAFEKHDATIQEVNQRDSTILLLGLIFCFSILFTPSLLSAGLLPYVDNSAYHQ